MALCVVPAAWGTAILGSTVTGDINFGGGSTNLYDPANGSVPATGYLNSPDSFNSPTVVISSGTPTFGFNDGFNLDVSDFSNGTQLVFTDTSLSGSFASNATITLTFTDPAFAGISLVSSTFSGLTYGIVGDVITINITAFTGGTQSTSQPLVGFATSPFLTATFNVSTTTTPEPSSFAMLAAGSAFLFWLRRKTA